METTAEEDAPGNEPVKAPHANGEAAKADAAPEPGAAAEKAPAAKVQDRSARAQVTGPIEDLFATVRRLEAFAADEAKRVSGKLMPRIESQAKKNIWVSLLLALGLGLVLGVWLTGGRRRD